MLSSAEVPKIVPEVRIDLAGKPSSAERVGSPRKERDVDPVGTDGARPDNEEPLLTFRYSRVVITDESRASRQHDSPAGLGIDVVADERAHLPGKVRIDCGLGDGVDELALQDEEVQPCGARCNGSGGGTLAELPLKARIRIDYLGRTASSGLEPRCVDGEKPIEVW